MRVGVFKNQNTASPPETSPNGATCLPCLAVRQATRQEDLTAVSAVSSFLMEIFPDGSARCSRLMVKSVSSFSRKHSEIAHLTKVYLPGKSA